MEKDIEVKSVKTVYLCDSCNIEVKHQKTDILKTPIEYLHICPKCKKQFSLNKRYPKVQTIEEGS